MRKPPPDPSDDLAALESAVQGAGRAGPTLARLAARAAASLEDGRTDVACARLRGFLSTVRIFGAVGRLTDAQVAQFTEHANAHSHHTRLPLNWCTEDGCASCAPRR